MLYGVGRTLDLLEYIGVALCIQAVVFLLHGLPYRSEKYYDLSGSMTHFAVAASSLCAVARLRSPRQMLSACFSMVWMVRLGTFLFLRISRDGKDGRFDAIKTCWLSFLGAWTIQVHASTPELTADVSKPIRPDPSGVIEVVGRVPKPTHHYHIRHAGSL